MKCDICKNSDTYVKKHQHEYIIKGKEIVFSLDRRFCSKCNNLVYDSELDNEVSIKAIEIYNKNYGIDKEEIIKLRNNYKLSQELFSKIIGCAKKTLISYEKGTSIPNDNYLIILKSLMSKPDLIITLIESNKEQFTDKEYEKVTSNFNFVKVNNYNLTEFNGYTKLDKNKLFNIIIYMAEDGILKTKLLKQLFYVDFLFYKYNCKSITGLEYCKLPFGPVPNQYEQLLSECLNEDLIEYNCEYKNNYECHNIIKKSKFNIDLFTDEELEVINKVKDYFKDYSSKEIVEYSHKEKAFVENDYYKPISYDYSFDISLKF